MNRLNALLMKIDLVYSQAHNRVDFSNMSDYDVVREILDVIEQSATVKPGLKVVK